MASFNGVTLEKGMRATFFGQMAMEPANIVSDIATEVTSDDDSEEYAWLDEAPQMEELNDELQLQTLVGTDYRIPNITYAAGIELRRTEIDDDKLGVIMMRVRQMAPVAARHPNALLIDLLANGTTYKGFDKVSFFNASHPNRGKSGVQSNLVTQTDTTASGVATDLAAAMTKMGGLKASNGEPFFEGLQSLRIVAPLGMRNTFKTVLAAETISGSSNVAFKGDDIQVITTSRLTGNAWYLLNVDGPVKPLIWQPRDPIEFVAQEEASSDSVFRREKYAYKTRYRVGRGYAFWQKAIKVA